MTGINSGKLMKKLKNYEPCIWINGSRTDAGQALDKAGITARAMEEAERSWQRFAPAVEVLFPETRANHGIIESKLVKINKMKAGMEKYYVASYSGELLLKCDSELPVAGSIKARGGIYEVLKHAEGLAVKHGLLKESDNYARLADPELREFFSNYRLAVGSTGNLGLSIGIMGAALGFGVTVHMSADAKAWKKKLLRSRGVEVIEYASDYSKAVEEGRKLSAADEKSYFIDDENSEELFLGYSAAAFRLKNQLDDMEITVDTEHPLFVYLPCGVGGAPGGICFGLKQLYKNAVHCFFVEPTHSPCMLLGMATGENEKISVQDIGLDNVTDADGLAVGRPSGFVGKTVKELVSGIYTVVDEELFKLLALLKDTEGLKIEPSAAPGLLGPLYLLNSSEGRRYIEDNGLTDKMKNAVHIAWATGGLFVPEDLMQGFYDKGKALLSSR